VLLGEFFSLVVFASEVHTCPAWKQQVTPVSGTMLPSISAQEDSFAGLLVYSSKQVRFRGTFATFVVYSEQKTDPVFVACDAIWPLKATVSTSAKRQTRAI